MLARVAPSIVKVHRGDEWGTGFLFGTSQHVARRDRSAPWPRLERPNRRAAPFFEYSLATLHTHRLELRPYRVADREAFCALVQDDELMRGLNGALSSDAAQSLFGRLVLQELSSGVLGWAAVTKGERAYCGHVFLCKHSRDERSIEIGFVLSKTFHGRGFATEMAAAARDYGRLQLGCRIVRATVDEDNVRSRAVLARIGMSEISRRHDADGAYLVYQDEARE